jgi:hypothetical protein
MQGTRDSNGCESAVEQTALPYQLFLSVVLTVVTFYCSSQEKRGEWFQTFTHCKQQCPTASYAVSVRASLPFSCYPVPPPDVWMTRLRHPPPVSRTYTLKYVGLWRFMLLLHRRMPVELVVTLQYSGRALFSATTYKNASRVTPGPLKKSD